MQHTLTSTVHVARWSYMPSLVLHLQSWKLIRRQFYFFHNFPLPFMQCPLWTNLDNIVLWGGGLFHGKWALEHKILKTGFKEFQRMVKFYAFLEKSTEFISMVVFDLKQKFIKD